MTDDDHLKKKKSQKPDARKIKGNWIGEGNDRNKKKRKKVIMSQPPENKN